MVSNSSTKAKPATRSASVASRYVRADAAQGETRSHGFFYKAESEFDGLLGLPIVGGSEPSSPARARSAPRRS